MQLWTCVTGRDKLVTNLCRRGIVTSGSSDAYFRRGLDRPQAGYPFQVPVHNRPSNQRFDLYYIDAFAGAGHREKSTESSTERLHGFVRPKQPRLFPDEETAATFSSDVEQERLFLDGSARLALRCTPQFHRFIFIEKNPSRCTSLRSLTSEFPSARDRIEVRQGDANEELREICRQNWRTRRAVLFLDPYGTQVSWSTIEAVAETEAIDLWVLFPIGAVVRMLQRDGQIPPSWKSRLEDLLGPAEWQKEFYKEVHPAPLFENEIIGIERASIDMIGQFFMDRLRSRFPAVAPEPAELRNSKNALLYLFCFAASNKRGSGVALRIANHILNMGK